MVVTLSKIEYCRVADSTPIGTAMATMIRSSTTFRASVTGNRSAILVSTGRPSGWKERPKSRRAMRDSHCQYCTWIGWSSPYTSRSFSTTSLGSWRPISSSPPGMGSPGARWITTKEMKVMPTSSGRASRSRRRANRSI